ncbi:alpha/beta hydrolase [Alcaligenes sp. DN25]|uniref:alpha/beta hydrolase n=1 Tax=Alcaligenes TaxID=507 RepID=UPI00202EAB24|nr:MULTISPECIES: alpha/beta hydrolase [Alcaligenes]URW82127.1 alpha/beta hydrolase [Alcaligenes sp. DN25]WEA66947.1 alpha/beta hydrolase [Alcaligenes faecalis]
MSNIVLLHGAWHGGWSWGGLQTLLEQHGHRVFTPTFTGLGDRAHLLTPEVGIHTHIQDIAMFLQYQELDDCVLIGHSYAGLIMPGLQEQLHITGSTHIQRAIYLDAVLVPCGQSWSDAHDPATRRQRLISSYQGSNSTTVFPVPTVANMGVHDPADIRWADRMLTPHPARTYTDIQDVGPDLYPGIYVDCTQPALSALESSKLYARQLGWPYLELQAGHDCMISHPLETLQTLKPYLSCATPTV